MIITKRNIKKILNELAEQYSVRLHYTLSSPHCGYARYWNNSITVSCRQSAVDMLCTFFHEIGHIYCWEKSLWSSYHTHKELDNLTALEKKKYIRTALKAERWVDRWAKKEMKRHFPNIRYNPSYSTDLDAQCFLQSIKKELNYE
jgi:hypothetical protein